MTDLSATLERLAERHGLGRNASEPEWPEMNRHHASCEAEYAKPLEEHRKEFLRRYGFDLRRK